MTLIKFLSKSLVNLVALTFVLVALAVLVVLGFFEAVTSILF